MTVDDAIRLLATIAGILLLGAGAWALVRMLGSGAPGTLVSADDGRTRGETLRSDRYGLVGRPDEVWRLRDGSLVPVEVKSRNAPPSGVLPSHRVQVEAYCLLLESSTGRAPPYGMVVYAGGVRRSVRWDDAARQGLLRLLEEVGEPYDGRATPSAAKCRGCRWRAGCDARAG